MCLCLVVWRLVSKYSTFRYRMVIARVSCSLIPVSRPVSRRARAAGPRARAATADAAGRRTSPPAGRAAGWSSGSRFRTVGAVASGSVRAAAGHARPPPAPNARRPGARSGDKRGAAGGGGPRDRASRTGLTARGASRAIAPRARDPRYRREFDKIRSSKIRQQTHPRQTDIEDHDAD